MPMRKKYKQRKLERAQEIQLAKLDASKFRATIANLQRQLGDALEKNEENLAVIAGLQEQCEESRTNSVGRSVNEATIVQAREFIEKIIAEVSKTDAELKPSQRNTKIGNCFKTLQQLLTSAPNMNAY